MTKTKIIYVISQPPAYDLMKENSRPPIYWDTSDGNWLGIFERDWGVRLGNAILNKTNDLKFEVWRPDERADDVYTYKFENGLVHKSFPAEKIKIKKNTIIFSKLLIEAFEYENNIIIHVGLNGLIFWYLKDIYYYIPFVATSHGEGFLPINQLFKLRKNIFNYFLLWKKHCLLKKFVKNVDKITYQSSLTKNTLINSYSAAEDKLYNITMGTDFSYFKPIEKDYAREKINVKKKEIIILTVCNLNPRKQIDRLIEILKRPEIYMHHCRNR